MRKLSPGYLAFMDGQVEKEKREQEREQAYRARQAARQQWLAEHTAEETCPKCGDTMYIMEGKYGKFLGCRNYPRCHGTREYGDPILCPQCGSEMVMRRGSKGRFYGCSNYPTCRGSLDIEEAKKHHKGVFVPAPETTKPQKKSPAKEPAPKVEKKPEPRSVYKPPSNEERYQKMVQRFPGNPKVDAEISQYVQHKQSHIDRIISQYEQDLRNVSSRMGILLGNSASVYAHSDDPKKEIALNLMKSLQTEINEIDAYGRRCLKDGISEESAKKLIDLIINTAKCGSQRNYLGDRIFISTNDLPQYDYTWGSLRKALPSELDGPGSKSIHKEIDCQKELIRLQREQIAALKEKIDHRESTLSAMKKALNQQKAEADSCRKKIEHNQTKQKKELSPLNQQLKIISNQLQQENENKSLLEQERKKHSLFAIKQRNMLGQQIKECAARIDSLCTQVQRYEQQIENVIDKYREVEVKLQNEIFAAELKQQQTDVQIQEIQKDIQKRTSESQLAQRNQELQEMLNALNVLENKVKPLREQHMFKMRYLATNLAAFDQLIEGRRKIMGIG